MWVIRYAIARWALRGGVTADIERILRADVCSNCGSWRCPHCHWLIMGPADHAPECPRFQLWR